MWVGEGVEGSVCKGEDVDVVFFGEEGDDYEEYLWREIEDIHYVGFLQYVA
jgi:hypothetical protein